MRPFPTEMQIQKRAIFPTASPEKTKPPGVFPHSEKLHQQVWTEAQTIRLSQTEGIQLSTADFPHG